MKLKSLIPWVVLITVAFAGYAIWRAEKTRADRAAAAAEQTIADLHNDAAVKDLEQTGIREGLQKQVDELHGMVIDASKIIQGYEVEREAWLEQDGQMAAAIEQLLTGEVKDLIEASPPLKEYVVALRSQNDERGETNKKDAVTIAELKGIITNQEKRIEGEIKIGLTWKKQYDDQVILNKGVEKAFADYRKARKKDSLIVTVAKVGGGFIAGVIL